MTEVTRILNQIEDGDPSAADQLLPLVYEELRRLAAKRLADEKPGQTGQATSLVHDAYVRLVDTEHNQRWVSRGHFFAAAAEAMRRILVENARRKARKKWGGDWERVDFERIDPVASVTSDQFVSLNDAIEQLSSEDSDASDLVKLRYFAGLSLEDAAKALNISAATAYRRWAYARAWLRCTLLERSN